MRDATEAGTCLLGTVDAWLLHNLTGGLAQYKISWLLLCTAQKMQRAGDH